MPTYAAMAVAMGAGRSSWDESDPASVSLEGSLDGGASRSRQRGKGNGDSSSGREHVARHYIGSDSGAWTSSENADESWDGSSSWSQWSNENWSWKPRRWEANYSNWEWELPRDDGWHEWHRQDRRVGMGDALQRHSGVFHRHDSGECHGEEHENCRDPMSPCSMPAARNVHGELPSGEVSSAGQSKEKTVSGEHKAGKITSTYPPIFRAKPGESFREWRRGVDFWIGGEASQLPKELIGPRLMVQLRDRAAQLVHHLTNEDVNKVNGLEVIMGILEKSPLIRQLDRQRVDQHRRRLMQLRRVAGESIESYVTRGSIYRTQLLALDSGMQMGECFYVGHLLDNAQLTKKDKVMIKTRAGSDREEEITNAMIDLAPELEGIMGCPIGHGEPTVAAKQGDEFLVQRPVDSASRYRKDVKETNAADADLGPHVEEYADGAQDDEDFEDVDAIPPEILAVENEAFALQFKARQKIAEVRKLRQYFRKDPDERKKAIAEKMKVAPCHKCGELGHWSRECPQRAHQAAVSSCPSNAANAGDSEWAALVSMCQPLVPSREGKSGKAYKGRFMVGVATNSFSPANQFKVNNVYWCERELRHHVIIDLGCVKSVVGVSWMNELMAYWREKGRWLRVFPEQEVFQFGNGESLKSRFQVQFEAGLAGKLVILAMSVVPGKCPPLLSRHACSQLGLSIDCSQHAVSSRKLGIKSFGMSQASNGHYLLSLDSFSEDHHADIPEDFVLENGVEACAISTAAMKHDQRSTIRDSEPQQSFSSVQHVEPLASRGTSSGRAGGSSTSISGALQDLSGSSQNQPLPRTGGLPGQLHPGRHLGGFGDRRDGSGSGQSGYDEEVLEVATPAEAEGEDQSLGRRCSRDVGDRSSSLNGDNGHQCPSSQVEGPARPGSDQSIRQASRGQERLGSCGTAHPSGSCYDRQEKGEVHGSAGSPEGTSGTDWEFSPISEPQSCMVSGGVSEHCSSSSISDEDVPVEKVSLADACEKGCGRDIGARASPMEEKSQVVGTLAEQGGVGSVWALWGNAAEVEQSGHPPSDVKEVKVSSLQRGTCQRLKQGVREALSINKKVQKVSRLEGSFVVLEIFAGSARLSRLAHSVHMPDWKALPPVDLVFGWDLRRIDDQQRLLALIDEEEPDLVTLSMPCGPWCSWMNLHDPDEVMEKRAADLPLWRFARKVWDKQVAGKRLVLTENPLASEGLKLTFMEDRPEKHRAKVAQCMFGLQDVENGKPHQKWTALDVNSAEWARLLEAGGQCAHHPEEHQRIEGRVQFQGQWWNRSVLAGSWPEKFCEHILRTALKVMKKVASVGHCAFHAETNPSQPWEVVPVSASQVPEEHLRHQLSRLGVAADRYGYITFEGEGQQVPRRIRSAVAHLHSALGHVSNDRLVRMLMLSGAGQQIQAAARNLCCQICNMVRPPRDAPQVAMSKPKTFNEKLTGDTFYVWDSEGSKFAVIHFIDGLTDFHVGDACVAASSDHATRVLQERWYAVFGPPDLLLTDAGTEFEGSVNTLNEVMGVKHDVVPEGAKWRLGHAERHGAILKLMILKMVKELNLVGLDDIRMSVVSATSSKNRLLNHGGVSPLQAVTGRSHVLPGSLMNQIASGKLRFVVNQELSREECLQRAERIRSAAVEAFMWIDSHETLRKALSSKSRPPKLELLREGATVFIYDPPAKRRGLARRIQDNVSWSGPGTVVCIERDRDVPNKIWVRLKGRVRPVALEKVRLATVEEMVGSNFVVEALEELQDELQQGESRAILDRRMMEGGEAPADDEDSVGEHGGETDPENHAGKETARMRLEKRLLDDVPLQIEDKHRKVSAEEEEPHAMSFERKKRVFEELARNVGSPSTLREAQLRGQLENAKQKMGQIAQEVQKHKKEKKEKKDKKDKKEKKQKRGDREHDSGARASTGVVDQSEEADEEGYDAMIMELKIGESSAMDEILLHSILWASPSEHAKTDELEVYARKENQKATEDADQAKLVTGKERLEYNWKHLSEPWKKAYVEPIAKAFRVYIEHGAIAGVPKGQLIDPRKILPSRMVLTNKGEPDLTLAELKARWIFGGHRDPEAGKFLTSSPTVSLVGHNLLVMIAVQRKWEIVYEDVSAAFLQGKPLPENREVYVRLPQGYPDESLCELRKFLGSENREDLAKLTKGGFGLPESPRLWYLEYKSTLISLGGVEMKLLPGLFCFYREDGELHGMAAIHVDDTRYAGAPTADDIWEQLHQRLNFGKKRKATEGWSKFCGRFEKQDPQTFEVTYSMTEYCQSIPYLKERDSSDMDRPLTSHEKTEIASIIGQINWAARQCRYDLSYAASHTQQLAGKGSPQALMWANKVVRRSKSDVTMKVVNLGCELNEMVVLSISDAAYAAQPGGGSQGGLLIGLAHPGILHGSAPIILVEGQSSRIQRIVRCSMAAELSEAATAFEHGDYVRAVLSEMLNVKFSLRNWKLFSSTWKHVLVLDAKVAYDAISSETTPTDRKLIVDIAILREAIEMEENQAFIRWVPGKEIPTDGMTKWYDNGALIRVMEFGSWSLVDTELAAKIRSLAAERKRRLKMQHKDQRGLV